MIHRTSSSFFRRILLGLGALLAASCVFAQLTLPAGQVGVSYSYTITTSPAASAGTVYSATGLPSGVAIGASTGQIGGKPAAAGTFTGVISLTDGAITNNFNYTWQVQAALGAPAITSSLTALAAVGSSFSYTLAASNSPTSFNVGSLPAGLSFDSANSQIAGTPTVAGTYNVALSANNASGTGASSTLVITVSPSGPVPAITSATTLTATDAGGGNHTVNYQITASNSPTSYSASGLPVGISVNISTGLISGTTTGLGVYSVTLSASNANGAGASSTLTLTVGAYSTITSAATLNATATQAISSFTLTASNTPGSFNVSGLPAGLSVNTSTGVISGTPTTAGTYNVTVSATNAVGTGPNATLTITVAAAPGGGGGGGGTTPPSITSASTASAVAKTAFNFTVTTSPGATSYAASGLPAGLTLNTSTGAISGTPTLPGVYPVSITATNAGGSARQTLTITVNGAPVITQQPQSAAAAVGGTVTLTVAASAVPAPTYQWRRNGATINGATEAALTLANFSVAAAGSYSVVVTNSLGSTVSQSAAIGVIATAKITGSGDEVLHNVTHPNGNVYDQVLLTGSSITVTADAGQITRTSYIDLNDDIVQVEFSGAGTMTLVLAAASGPAKPVNYIQDVEYMKGQATIVVTGADETSNLSVFSVGRANAVNQALFRNDVTYDGVADIASVSIASANGKFGGLRTANAVYFGASGQIGVNAPGVQFVGPVFVGDINGSDTATATLIIGGGADVRITGGDLLQSNAGPVAVDGIGQLKFTNGTTSHGLILPAQNNRARLEQNGVDVTSAIVVNPGP